MVASFTISAMKRRSILVMAVIGALVLLFATPARGQDGPTLTVEPSSVDAAGEFEFTVTGAGWTASPPILLFPCTPREDGDLTAITVEDDCDADSLVPATPDADGNFEQVVTFTVPEGGLVIGAGDAGQSERAVVLVSVGAAEEEPPAEDPPPEEEPPVEEDPPAEEAPPEEEEDLANTGVESGLVAVGAVALLLAGAMVVTTTRRIGRA